MAPSLVRFSIDGNLARERRRNPRALQSSDLEDFTGGSRGVRFRLLAASWEESLSGHDQRKDHSFFSRAIAVITGMILPEHLLNGQVDQLAGPTKEPLR